MSKRIASHIESIGKLLNRSNIEFQKLVSDLIIEGSSHHSSSWAAHMTPDIDSPALLGQLLAALHNGNLLSPDLYPHLASMEKELIEWLCQLFQQKYGHFIHGSTYANLEALWHARENSQNSSNTVYASEDAHYSIAKACNILGLNFQSIPTNERGEISIVALLHACKNQPPLAIIATAGTSSYGAIDSINDCEDIAKQFSSWCHVDAAWGGALVFTQYAHFFDGLNQVDSVSFDPHKALGQPKSCSILLYQTPLEKITKVNYLSQNPKKTLLGSHGGELFLPLWCSLQLSGEQAFAKQIAFRLQQAKYFYTALEKNTDWWLQYSHTGIICFRPPASLNLSKLVQRGTFSQLNINEHIIYRAVFASDSIQAEALIAVLNPYFKAET